MAEEKPTIEGAESEGTPSDDMKVDTEGLLKELETLNISDPKQISDMAHASQQTGRAWNEVGQLRQQVAQLQEQMRHTQNQYREPSVDTEFSNEPIDVKDALKGAVREFYNEEVIRPQRQAAEMYWQQKSQIQSDTDYQNNPAIREMWDKHEQNPDFQMRMQMGQTSLVGEFDKLRITYFREIAKRSHETIKGLTESPKVQTPFVEQGDTRSTPAQAPIDERKETANKIDKQRRDGTLNSDDALKALISTYLPKTDPIFRRE